MDFNKKECKLCGVTKANVFYWINTDAKDLEGKLICLCGKCYIEGKK